MNNIEEEDIKSIQSALKVLDLRSQWPPSKKSIDKSFRRLSLHAHPDRKGGSKEAQQKLGSARALLLKYAIDDEVPVEQPAAAPEPAAEPEPQQQPQPQKAAQKQPPRNYHGDEKKETPTRKYSTHCREMWEENCREMWEENLREQAAQEAEENLREQATKEAEENLREQAAKEAEENLREQAAKEAEEAQKQEQRVGNTNTFGFGNTERFGQGYTAAPTQNSNVNTNSFGFGNTQPFGQARPAAPTAPSVPDFTLYPRRRQAYNDHLAKLQMQQQCAKASRVMHQMSDPANVNGMQTKKALKTGAGPKNAKTMASRTYNNGQQPQWMHGAAFHGQQQHAAQQQWHGQQPQVHFGQNSNAVNENDPIPMDLD